ncbi:MAG: adenylate/guanylate cyclase domain-containing protein [Candidatus Sericytochromatia bacterium]
MSFLAEDILSYIPKWVLKSFAEKKFILDEPQVYDFKASVMFLDISGFTSLAEELAKKGVQGAEELSKILNSFFDEIIKIINKNKGDILKFAGDAILAVWSSYLLEEELKNLTVLALNCAYEIQEKVEYFQLENETKLFIKIGVDVGNISIFYLGGINNHWEMLVNGEPIINAGLAQQKANTGEIITTHNVLSIIEKFSNYILYEKIAETYYKILKIEKELSKNITPLENINFNSEIFKLKGLLPNSILYKIEANFNSWLAELRQVSVIFLGIKKLVSKNSLEFSDNLIKEFQKIVFYNEGVINKINIDEKGIAIIFAFGLPYFSHRDDSVRAIKTALQIQNKLNEFDIDYSIGITTGKVFCGEIGTTFRKEYTIIGDKVNLSARLMQRSFNNIICDGETCTSALRKILFNYLGEIEVKGKDEKIKIYEPIKTLDYYYSEEKIIGFDNEIENLKDRLNHNYDLIIIEGDLGSGKTLIIENIKKEYENNNYQVIKSECNLIEKNSPYYIWSNILSEFLLKKEIYSEDELSLEKSLVSEDKNKLLYYNIEEKDLPILNQILGFKLENEDNNIVKEENFYKIPEIIAKIIFKEAENKKVIIILENIHYIDSDSLQIILYLLNKKGTKNISIILTTRIKSRIAKLVNKRIVYNDIFLDYLELINYKNTFFIQLENLSKENIKKLLCIKLNTIDIETNFLNLIYDKTNGNPLFTEEIITSLNTFKDIDILDNKAYIKNDNLSSFKITTSIEGSITSRFDLLSEEQQLVLKLASIIGFTFDTDILFNIYPLENEKTNLTAYIKYLEKIELITKTDKKNISKHYSFSNDIIYQVVYNLILFEQKKLLHQKIAEYYEKNHTKDIYFYYNSLFYHWLKAENYEKTIFYYKKSAEKSLQSGSYKEAISLYNLALDIINDNKVELNSYEKADINYQLGEVYFDIGEFNLAQKYLEIVLVLLDHPTPDKKEIHKNLLKQIIIQLFHIIFKPQSNKEDPNILKIINTYERLGQIHYLNGNNIYQLYNGIFMLNLAEKIILSAELAKSYAICCLITGSIGFKKLAELYKNKALTVSKKIAQNHSKAWVLQLISIYEMSNCNWNNINKNLNEAINIYNNIGNARHKNECIGILSFAKYSQGEIQESIRLSTESVKIANQRADITLEMRGTISLVKNYLLTKDLDSSTKFANKALELANKNVEIISKIYIYSVYAFILIKKGDLTNALIFTNKSYELIINNKINKTFFENDIYFFIIECCFYLKEKEKLLILIKNLNIFAKTFDLAKPKTILYENLYQIIYENKKPNLYNLEKGLNLSKKLGLKIDESIYNYYLNKFFHNKYKNNFVNNLDISAFIIMEH